MSSPCSKCGGSERNRWGHCVVCHKAGKDARYRANREKAFAGSQAWAEANPDKKQEIGERSRLKKYGLTLEQYHSMLQAQEGRCHICKELFGTLIHIDHDHQSGAVRGLLCHKCNVGLGHFRDDPELLRAAAIYLETVVPQAVCVPKKRPLRGDDRRRKVTDEMLVKMQTLRGQGSSFGGIAKQLGLSRAWVYLKLKAVEGGAPSTTI